MYWKTIGQTCALVAVLLGVTAIQASFGQTVEKLSTAVNSPVESEVFPVVTADGTRLYFARTREGLDGTTVLDIWSSVILGDTSFAPATVIGGELGSRFGVEVVSVSPDNNTLYLHGKLKRDEPAGLFIVRRIRDGWSIPQPIEIPNLRARSVVADFAFGPDEKTVLLSINRDSSLGDRDLYVSFRQDDDSWSTPMWLGPDVNSDYTEMTPYLAADNRTLYFSSNRPGSIGAIDVYRSTRLDDTWQHWSAPADLGAPVNRLGRTTYYTEDARGEYAYFAWRLTDHDQTDIYRVRIHGSRAVALVHGRVLDENGKPVAATVRYSLVAGSDSSSEHSVGTAHSDPTTGDYQLVLPAGANYVLYAQRSGYFVTSENLDLRGLHQFERVERDLHLTHARVGTHITLENVLFATDSATLLPSSDAQLNRVVEFMREHAGAKILVRGHTDSTGMEAHNVALSKARAESVRAYLLAHGIAGDRVDAEGVGSAAPIGSNATEAGRAENRRVEFVIEQE